MAESAEVLALPAEGGATPLGPQPGEVWSLWDMLRAYAHEFCEIDRTLSWTFNNMPATDEGADEFERANGKTWREWTYQELLRLTPVFAVLPLGPSVKKQLGRTMKVFAKPASYHDAFLLLSELRSRFRDELEDLKFLHVTPTLAEGLGEAPPFGGTVEQAFPSAGLEIRDAARCLALGQGTACVFHCMRALEPVLIALGAKFGNYPVDIPRAKPSVMPRYRPVSGKRRR